MGCLPNGEALQGDIFHSAQLDPLLVRHTSFIVVEKLLTSLVFVLSYIWGFAESPNFHEFSVDNINLQHSFVPESQVTIPGWLLAILAFLVPILDAILVVALDNVPRKVTKLRILHKFCFALLGSLATQMAIVSVSKNICGLPRPDMLARCQPNMALIIRGDIRLNDIGICTTEDHNLLKDGFRTFPSLHSSSRCTF